MSHRIEIDPEDINVTFNDVKGVRNFLQLFKNISLCHYNVKLISLKGNFKLISAYLNFLKIPLGGRSKAGAIECGGIPEESGQIFRSWRKIAEGSAIGWPARNGKDIISSRSCRRSWCTVLPRGRSRVRRDSCWPGCPARQRLVQ